jgi:hypothetical protein
VNLTLRRIDDRFPQQFLTATLQRAPELVVRIFGHDTAHFLLIERLAAMGGDESGQHSRLIDFVGARHDPSGQMPTKGTDEVLSRLFVVLRLGEHRMRIECSHQHSILPIVSAAGETIVAKFTEWSQQAGGKISAPRLARR